MSNNLRYTQIYKALHKANLILGGDRELVLFALIIFAAVSVTTLNIVFIGICIVLWGISIYFFRKMAKADPYMRSIYLKQRKYNDYYPPRSRPFRVD